MNTSNLIPPALAVLILLVLTALFVLSYTNNFQRRMAMVVDLPPRRLRNVLLALAAMTFLLLNPLVEEGLQLGGECFKFGVEEVCLIDEIGGDAE